MACLVDLVNSVTWTYELLKNSFGVWRRLILTGSPSVRDATTRDVEPTVTLNSLTLRDTLCLSDVGGGIGRVSKHLLLPMFGRVDILESNQGYLEESKEYIGDPRLERRICAGMEDFSPETGRYSLIWIQWCIIYLTDADLVRFFKSCTAAVKPGGFVILKDNVCNTGFVVDKEDSSVTRSEKYLTELFAEAGVEVVTSRLQGDFPEHLFPVKMFALRAKGP
uniref:Alpha N-terminal protein methyltransferase 1 n=1 Tax=Rhodosorus marinus TaxID=101924 RepID=A0A7S3EFI9_9RHOD|mmetsp:Transcript_28253/g.110949  ORF Transcript_28253/g.110949 Transcript_28253/m.110949 type:complete len:222 (+) Transcript_28253:366-1031(+)